MDGVSRSVSSRASWGRRGKVARWSTPQSLLADRLINGPQEDSYVECFQRQPVPERRARARGRSVPLPASRERTRTRRLLCVQGVGDQVGEGWCQAVTCQLWGGRSGDRMGGVAGTTAQGRRGAGPGVLRARPLLIRHACWLLCVHKVKPSAVSPSLSGVKSPTRSSVTVSSNLRRARRTSTALSVACSSLRLKPGEQLLCCSHTLHS